MASIATAERRVAADPVRVMVVDDSALIRGFISQWVQAETGFAVVGTAANGQEALDLLDVLRPDIVLLDLDMPVLDGLATLPHLLSRRPDLSVMVVSTLTLRNARISLECLARGAVDYIPKPETRRELAGTVAFRQELILKLRGLVPRHRGSGSRSSTRLPLDVPEALAFRPARPRVLGIGASTGGPNALAQTLLGLRSVNELLPILVVQHMPELFTKAFAEQLRAKTGLNVNEAEHGERLRPGRVYLAPGGYHLGLSPAAEGPASIRIDASPPVQHCRPAVDVMFSDLAKIFASATLGLVLTGMGTDGTEGARAIVRAGGAVFVQDESTSTVWGMPGSIANAGLARRILPLDDLPRAINETVGLA